RRGDRGRAGSRTPHLASARRHRRTDLTMAFPPELAEAVRRWVDDDPDPATAEHLTRLLGLALGGSDDPTLVRAAHEDLADRFRGHLEFGTAGLRGALGGGPNRMNRAVVIRAAAGLVRYLTDALDDLRAD